MIGSILLPLFTETIVDALITLYPHHRVGIDIVPLPIRCILKTHSDKGYIGVRNVREHSLPLHPETGAGELLLPVYVAIGDWYVQPYQDLNSLPNTNKLRRPKRLGVPLQ